MRHFVGRLGLTAIWLAAAIATASPLIAYRLFAIGFALTAAVPAFLAVWICDRALGDWIGRTELWVVPLASPGLYIASGACFGLKNAFLDIFLQALGPATIAIRRREFRLDANARQAVMGR